MYSEGIPLLKQNKRNTLQKSWVQKDKTKKNHVFTGNRKWTHMAIVFRSWTETNIANKSCYVVPTYSQLFMRNP